MLTLDFEATHCHDCHEPMPRFTCATCGLQRPRSDRFHVVDVLLMHEINGVPRYISSYVELDDSELYEVLEALWDSPAMTDQELATELGALVADFTMRREVVYFTTDWSDWTGELEHLIAEAPDI